ncbi:MAG: hypothetical protein AAB444_02355 [Patescibacteria group bacterium]
MRNWKNILQLPDTRTRIAVALTTDPEILACYRRGFPNLFLKEGDSGTFCVPLSALMAAAEDYSRATYPNYPKAWNQDRNFRLGFAAEAYPHLRLPVAFQWTEPNGHPPADVTAQIVGQRAGAGMSITLAGAQYRVVDIAFLETPEIGMIINGLPIIESLSLVKAEYIALDK